jgi:pyruvate kinase
LGGGAVVVLSRSGVPAGVVSAARPAAPVLVVSGDAAASRCMNVDWALVCIVAESEGTEDPESLVRRLVGKLG